MYKELVISIIIVVMIVTLDICTQKYTNKAINEINERLSEIRDNIRSENINGAEISKKINDVYQQWLRYHEKLVYYIEHNELEKVETDFVTCKSYIESEDYDLAIAELEKTMFVLQHINDKYKFNLENIF